MEQYREKLKLGNRVTAVLCVILAVFSVLGFAAEAGLVELTPVSGDSHWQSMWRGMISGVSTSIQGLMIFSLVRNTKALKDEKKLRKRYIEANDERQNQIWTSTRAASVQLAMPIALVAGLIIGYFNMAVGITIIAVEFFHAIVGSCLKLYYNHKY